MKRLALVLAIGIVVLMHQASIALPAATGDSLKSVEENIVHWNFAGEYGRVWQTMHPAYHKVVSRSFWQSCKEASADKNPGVEFISVHATDTYADTLTFPVLGRLHVTAVTATVKFKYLGGVHSFSDTVYYVKVSGQWKGLWDTKTYQAYKAHRCPA